MSSRLLVIPSLLLWYVFVLSHVDTVRADSGLDNWRNETATTRQLAENDVPHAYEKAQRLQANLPAIATPADQVTLLNLLARIELYGGKTELAAQHIQQAQEITTVHNDQIGQIESDLILALNATNQGKIDAMIEAVNHAMTLLDGVNQPDLQVETMLHASMMYLRLGQINDAIKLALQTMEIAKNSDRPLSLMYAHHGLAILFDQQGSIEKARYHFQQMVEQARAADSKFWQAFALLGLSDVIRTGGDVVAGDRLNQEAIQLCRKVGAPFCLSKGLFSLAGSLQKQGRHTEALLLYDEVIAVFKPHDNKIGLWWTLNARSSSHQALGKLDASLQDAELSQQLAKEIGSTLYLSESARRMAAIIAARGEYQRAYQLSVEAADLKAKLEREQSSERITKLAQQYQDESKQRRIDELIRHNEHQQLQQRWLLTLIGAALLMLLGTLFFLLRLRRSNRLLGVLNTQVQRSQNKMQAILDAVPDPLFVLDLDGCYYEYHSPRSDLLAVSPEALPGKTVFDILPPEAAEICISALHEAQEKGFSSGKQFELTLAQGSLWFELSVARKVVAKGNQPMFVVLSRDITERITHMKELQRWHDIFEHAEWGVVIGSRDGKTLELMNPAFARMHGYTMEELTGHPIAEVFAPQSREDFPKQIRIAHEKGHHAFESWHIRKDGSTFPVYIDITVVYGEDNQVLHRIVNVQDITERKQAEREIMLLNRAINASSESVFLMNEQGLFVYVNDAACRTLDYSRDELLTMTMSDIDSYFTPEEHTKLQDELFAFGPIHGVLESQQRTRVGRVLPVDVSAAVIECEGERFALMMVRDITERKLSEQALRESEEKYRTLIQKIQAAVIVHDADTRILTSNTVAQQILGLSEDQLTGKMGTDPAWHFFAEDGSQLPLDEYPVNIVLSSHSSLRNYVIRVHRPNQDSDVWALVNADPVFDKKNEISQIIITFIDITQRKCVEETLAIRERQFRTLVENTPDTIARYDTQCRRIYANPTFAKLAGVEVEALLGMTPTQQHQNSEQSLAYEAKLRQSLDNGIECEHELSWSANGKPITSHIHIVPERDAKGNVASILAIGRDISEIKESEKRLDESYAQLRELGARRETAREEERKHIAQEIHDEFGQLLTAIRMEVSLLKQHFLLTNPEFQKKAQHIVTLVDKTIKEVRSVASSLRPAALEAGIVPALEWLADEFSSRAGIPCELTLTEQDIEFSEERAIAIFRIVQESLTNVARHAYANNVFIILKRISNGYQLLIVDNGKGFEPSKLKRNSLGLLGIRERIFMLGGELNIISSPGQGTILDVYVPE